MFLDEIIEKLGASGVYGDNYSIFNYAGRGVYIQGKINLQKHTNEEIKLKLGSQRYCILGTSLAIQNLSVDALFIKGMILSIVKENT